MCLKFSLYKTITMPVQKVSYLLQVYIIYFILDRGGAIKKHVNRGVTVNLTKIILKCRNRLKTCRNMKKKNPSL